MCRFPAARCGKRKAVAAVEDLCRAHEPGGDSSDPAVSLPGVQDPRERLLRRVEVEARAFANSDGTTSQLRLGRVQGLLEAGVLAGYWRKRDSVAAAAGPASVSTLEASETCSSAETRSSCGR
jgi:hypothetical protein